MILNAVNIDAKRRKVAFLDPSLRSAYDHHYVVAQNYASLLRASGRSVVFFGNSKLDCAGLKLDGRTVAIFQYEIEDAFRVSRYCQSLAGTAIGRIVARTLQAVRKPRPLPRSFNAAPALMPVSPMPIAPLFSNHSVHRTLAKIIDDEALGPLDDIVVLNVDPAMLTAIDARIAHDEGTGPRWNLCFMYPERDFLSDSIARAYIDTITRLGANPNIRFYGELDAHITELSRLSGRHFEKCITPVRIQQGRGTMLCEKSPFRIAALGAGRSDKGYERLRPIAEAVLEFGLDSKRVKFRIQASTQYGLQRENKALAMMPNVTLLPGQLEPALYDHELRSCHAVLMPYDRQAYVTRGSGVIVDALLEGVPILISEGIALSSSVAAGNGLVASDPRTFACAISQLRNQYEQFARAALEEAEKLLRETTQSPLIKRLLAR